MESTQRLKGTSKSTSKGATNSQPPSNLSKKEKKNLTAYWGVDLSDDCLARILSHNEINVHLSPTLIPLKHIHSTLLYVGKKVDDRESVFTDFEGKECTLVVSSFGVSDVAISIKVDQIKTSSEEVVSDVPTFAECQHITLALSEGTKAVDSIKSILGDPDHNSKVVTLITPLALKGIVKRFRF